MDLSELQLLEEKIRALMERCQALAQEKRRLSQELEASQGRVRELEEELNGMRQERSAVKERVAGLIELIDQARLGEGEGAHPSQAAPPDSHSLFSPVASQEE